MAHGTGFLAQRSPRGLKLRFPPLRALAPPLGLMAFASLCALMPALGLGALLPLRSGDAAAMMTLALIGGFAAPFVLASATFALLGIYQLSNTLLVTIGDNGIETERRLFGLVIRRAGIAHDDIAEIEPRSSARYQNLFSTTPRYALVALHRVHPSGDIIIAEDLLGELQMRALRELVCQTLNIK